MAQHITIICSSFPPEKGGAPTRIYNMAALLRDHGYRVSVITAMPNYPKGAIFPGYRGKLKHKEIVDGIQVRRIWLSPSNSGYPVPRGFSLLTYFASMCLFCAPQLFFKKADLVIVSSPPLVSGWFAAVLSYIGRKKLLVNISDIWPLTATEMGVLPTGRIFHFLQGMERRMYAMAGAFTGQSEEILTHIQATLPHNKPSFLYRNLQEAMPCDKARDKGAPKKIIYAGNLGNAQGILALCREMDFAAAGTGLHIYGDGVERNNMEQWIKSNPHRGIFLHATVTQEEMGTVLKNYSAVLIPLKTTIRGAVPSKLFMAIAHQLPVLFCGGGEGAQLVTTHRLGWVSEPGDYKALTHNIGAWMNLSEAAGEVLNEDIKRAQQTIFSKRVQDEQFIRFLEEQLR